MTADDLKVEIAIGSRWDRLVLIPEKESRNRVAASLRSIGIVPATTSDGMTISFRDGNKLSQISNIHFHWSTTAAMAVENRASTAASIDRVRSTIDRLTLEGHSYARKLLSDLPTMERLDNHQLVNVAAMTLPGAPGLCLFDEQGLGKTVSCIYAFDVLAARDEADFALIVAPKSMVPEWPGDFARFMGDRYCVQIAAGTRAEKLKAFRADADVLVTNYETVVSMERELTAMLRTRKGRTLLVVDESFFVKNLDAHRTTALRRIREFCRRAFVLCGTPAPNSPGDVVQQFNIADYGITFDGVSLPKEREPAHDKVSEILGLKGLFIRHLKAEALPDLPGKTFNRVFVPFSPVQEGLYRDALGGYLRDLESSDEKSFARHLTNFLARRTALLQICSNPKSIVPGYSEVPAKLVALDSLLHELVEVRREKVVIWSYFTESVNGIVARFRRYSPVRYDGQVPDVADRREAVRSFQEDDTTMLFVANPAAAGAGLTLHRARYAIYESLSNQAAHYLQSIDRIHRRGQDRAVEYVVLLCEDSIELKDYEALIAKEQSAASLLGDPHQESMTRSLLMAEATAAWNLLEKHEVLHP